MLIVGGRTYMHVSNQWLFISMQQYVGIFYII